MGRNALLRVLRRLQLPGEFSIRFKPGSYALTVVQDLMALAEVTDTSHAPIVTVPAN